MVRFSDFITMDKVHGPRMPASHKEPNAKAAPLVEADIEKALDVKELDEILNKVAGSEETSICYRHIYEHAVDIRKRLQENRHIDPAPVIGLFRHAIENHLVDDLFNYAISVPDHLGTPSRVVTYAIAQLKMGAELCHDTNRLLKSGFVALLQITGGDDPPDYILQKGRIISPKEISAIIKNHDPGFELPAYINALHPKVEGGHSGMSPVETIANEDAGPLKDPGPSSHIDDKSPGQGPTDEITEQENAYRQLAEISSRKRSLLPGSFWAIVVVVAIALIALRLTGVLPLKKEQGPGPIALRETGPTFKREKISQPAEALTPAPVPVQEEIPKPDSQPTIEEDRQPKTMEQTVPEVKPPEVASGPEPTSQKAEANPVPPAIEHYPYSLNMESLKTKRQVDRSIAELKKKGLNPYWIFVSLPDKGQWYRVFVGNFRTEAEADAFQKAHGIRADRILKTAYAVRIGSYSSKEELDQKMTSLKAAGYCPYIIEQQGRYDLLVGAYQTRQAAEQRAVRLKALGFDCEMVLR
jgi:cell division septation protein DedD